jgi:hypothetical protein
MHTHYRESFSDLPGDDVKLLMIALCEYVEEGTKPDFADNVALRTLFTVIRAELDRDYAKWEETKAKRIEAGHKGGIASAERREQAKQNQANQANA